MKKFSIAAFFLIVCLSVLLSCKSENKPASIEIYVSVTGSDSSSGTKEFPLKSLEAARNRIRKLKTGRKGGKYTVYIREGIYRFQKPFELSGQDSGNDDNPVEYCAYGNEKVVFSGSAVMSSRWKRYDDRLWVTDTVLTDHRGFSPRRVWINGKESPLARYPDLIPGKRPFGGVAADCISARRVSGWKSPEGAYVHGMQQGKWGSMHYRLIDVRDNIPHLFLVSTNTTTMYNSAQLHKEDRFVENIFEELDTPGEWFYDRLEHRVYYYPRTGEENINNAVFEFPVATSLLEIRGNSENPVKNIRFHGIHFEKTFSTWFLTTEHLPLGDYAIYRGAAVVLEGTENCAVEDCSFEDLGGNGIILSGYNRNSSVKRSIFRNLHANGIILAGQRDAMRDEQWCTVTDEYHTEDLKDRWGYILTYPKWEKPFREFQDSPDTVPGPKTENYPRYCKIEDNLVTRAGELEKQAAGILLSMCAENTISHNSIYDLPRAGICINDGSWGGNIIEHNDVFHTVLSTADHGPINSWGRDRHWSMKDHGQHKRSHETSKRRARLDSYRTTVIRHNRFSHDIPTHSWGIDLDDGSSNFHIYNNLTLGCCIKLREGFFRTVENNIFISPFPIGKHVCYRSNEDIIRNNIFFILQPDVAFGGIASMPHEVKEMDHNLYYMQKGGDYIFKISGRVPDMDFKSWQKTGLDVHSIVADPLFRSWENRDFRLAENSPAFNIGFKEFDLDSFGTSVPEFKAEADAAHKKFDNLKIVFKENAKADASTRSWLGCKIKDMTTEAEKSAAGIDDIKGVIVLTAPKGSLFFKSGGQAGDVILKVNDNDIRNIEALILELRKVQEKKEPVRLWVDGNPPAHEIRIKP